MGERAAQPITIPTISNCVTAGSGAGSCSRNQGTGEASARALPSIAACSSLDAQKPDTGKSRAHGAEELLIGGDEVAPLFERQGEVQAVINRTAVCQCESQGRSFDGGGFCQDGRIAQKALEATLGIVRGEVAPARPLPQYVGDFGSQECGSDEVDLLVLILILKKNRFFMSVLGKNPFDGYAGIPPEWVSALVGVLPVFADERSTVVHAGQ